MLVTFCYSYNKTINCAVLAYIQNKNKNDLLDINNIACITQHVCHLTAAGIFVFLSRYLDTCY